MTSKGGLHSLLVVPSFPQGGRFITSKTKMKVNTTDMVAKGTVTGSSTSHCDQENTSYCHVHQIDFSLSATQHIYIYASYYYRPEAANGNVCNTPASTRDVKSLQKSQGETIP